MIGLPHILAVALGGALGAVARFGVSHALQGRAGSFPLGTFAVNAAGCLAIGFCFVWFHEEFNPGAADQSVLRDGVRVGFLGALTTFSTYSLESLELLQKQQYGQAGLYLLGSVVVGLGAAWLGLQLGKLVWSS